jgi:Ca2+-transporting ATPase
MRSLTEVVRDTNLERGLDPHAVTSNRERFGINRLTPLPREPLWKKFLAKFDDAIIKILLAAALLSMLVELFKISHTIGVYSLGGLGVALVILYFLRLNEWVPTLLFTAAIVFFVVGATHGHILVEGLAVMIAIALATGVAFFSEYQSDREFEVLNAEKESLQSKVLRGGAIQEVAIDEVVVGDVIQLEMGDEIPADGRVLKATEFQVDQSLMTGESEPVHKAVRPVDETTDGPEHPGCLYRGTQVVDGIGTMVVTEVGDATYLGQLARRLSAGSDEEERIRQKLSITKEMTPLQHKLADLASVISRVGYAAAGFIFLAELVRGLLKGAVYWPTNNRELLSVISELLDYFITMVIIIVVAVPEGLPMSVTVSLALAMRKMTRANSLVRQLVACETIGSATVICTDKTGTLTQNRMRVDRLSWGERLVGRDADWPRLDPAASWPRTGSPLDNVALNAAVNSTATLTEKDGRIQTIGNSTEGALLQWLRENGIDHDELRRRFPELYQVHFSSDRKRMTTVIREGKRLLCFVKGAPEWMLAHARHRQDDQGVWHPLDDHARRRIQARIDHCARAAMRTLAFAFAILPDDMPATEEALHDRRDDLEKDLVYVGFVAIRDPLRDDVKQALDDCRSAGIAVKMITGDNVETARAIGHEVGLVATSDAPIDVPGAAVMTSRYFNELTDETLSKELPNLRIVARARPLDKYRLVRLLQERGDVVAVTGDGTNDAPALKKADVGLAMGIAGTEVAKEASKIVLLDDSFATIVRAVEWGRSLYENIQRFLQFQLTINVSALAITFLGILFFDVRAPFTVLQLLWINVIMDTFASIALCSEPPRKEVMRAKPKRRDESIVTQPMMTNILVTAGFFVVVMLGILLVMKGDPRKPGLFAGGGPWSVEVGPTRQALTVDQLVQLEDGSWRAMDEPDLDATVNFTVLQVTLFFTIYVFFQIWNQVNCRSLSPRTSGLSRIWENRVFLAIVALTALGQVMIVTFGGAIFKVEPLGPVAWLGVIAFTASVLLFGEIVRRLRAA